MLGMVDEFRRRGIPVFGPTQAAAQLEASKSFSKAFMTRHRIPTAMYAGLRFRGRATGRAGALQRPSWSRPMASPPARA